MRCKDLPLNPAWLWVRVPRECYYSLLASVTTALDFLLLALKFSPGTIWGAHLSGPQTGETVAVLRARPNQHDMAS